MKNPGKEAIRQRKIYLTMLIIMIILAAVLGGGYYLWSQTKETAEVTSAERGQKKQAQSGESKDTIQYQGNTYKYNDHLSNYLFMGIDSREDVVPAGCRAGRCNFSGFSGQSYRRGKSFIYSQRLHDKD